jgi:hypothetical protein
VSIQLFKKYSSIPDIAYSEKIQGNALSDQGFDKDFWTFTRKIRKSGKTPEISNVLANKIKKCQRERKLRKYFTYPSIAIFLKWSMLLHLLLEIMRKWYD